jgi:hypothetical protein
MDTVGGLHGACGMVDGCDHQGAWLVRHHFDDESLAFDGCADHPEQHGSGGRRSPTTRLAVNHHFLSVAEGILGRVKGAAVTGRISTQYQDVGDLGV